MSVRGKYADIVEANVYERRTCEWWSRGEFRLQRCADCGTVMYPAAPVCRCCLSADLVYSRLSGDGTVYSAARYHRQYFDELPVPYVCVTVLLAEGPLFITSLDHDGSLAELVGRRVRIAIEDGLPTARLVGGDREG